jgi:hypothetical protein
MKHESVPLKGFCVQFAPDRQESDLIPQFKIDFCTCRLHVHPAEALVNSVISLTDNTIHVELEEYFTINDLNLFRNHLLKLKNQQPSTFSCRTEDALVYLESRPDSDTGDIVIAGGMPSADYHWNVNAARSNDPFFFRKCIKLSVVFEYPCGEQHS